MCRGTVFEAWQADCVRRLLTLNQLQATLLLCTPDSGFPGGHSQRTERLPGAFLFRTYRRMLCNPAALRPVDLSDELSGVPRMACHPMSGGRGGESVGGLVDADVDAIKAHRLDFVLALGFEDVPEKILDAARYGVWVFRYGDGTRRRRTPPAFWEIFDGDPVSVATLQRLTGNPDEGIILKRGCFPTIGYSYAANLNQVLGESADWPAQVCLGLLHGTRGTLDDPPARATTDIGRPPGNAETVLFLARMAKNLLVETCRVLFRHEQWNVGLAGQGIDAFLVNARPDIRWLPDPGSNRFLADPFGVSVDGCVHLYCEDYDYKSMKGKIAHLQVSGTGCIASMEIAIDEPYHLSYPYLIRHRGELYCIPESSGSGQVVLYKALAFPGNWEKVATLIEDFAGLDVTVFQHDGRWWIACADVTDGRCHKLFLWYAADIFGPWAPHLLNPVKLDVTSSRPGGTPFVHDGQLYRPAQDCSRTYGGRIVINRVCELTTSGFKEEVAAVIEPDAKGPYRKGIHTISAAGEFTLVDGKRYVFSPNACLHAVGFLLRKLTVRSTRSTATLH
ncbi:MAG: hypothetical protein WAL83_12750 [Arenicellales bacterium]